MRAEKNGFVCHLEGTWHDPLYFRQPTSGDYGIEVPGPHS